MNNNNSDNAIAEQLTRQLAPITRRRLLRWSLLAGTVSVVGVGAWLHSRPLPPVPNTISYLSASQYRLFQAMIPALLPPHDTLPGVPESALLQRVDRLMGTLEEAVRRDFGVGLSLLDHGPSLSGYFPRFFTELTTPEKTAFLDTWQQSGTIKRALASTVKKLVYSAYWLFPETWPAIEFDGPVSDRWQLTKLGNAPMPERTARAERPS